MNIYKIYKKHKRINKKNKEMALVFSLKQIFEIIANAEVNKSFVSSYKFYKQIAFMGSTLLPNVCLGLGTGTIMLCVGLFVANIPDLWLQTISNAVLVLLGFYLLLFMYMLGSLHTYLNILVPYTVNLMEEKINIYNLQCIEEDENQPTYRVKVKRKRR